MNLIKQEIVERDGIEFLEEEHRDENGTPYYLWQRLTPYTKEELERIQKYEQEDEKEDEKKAIKITINETDNKFMIKNSVKKSLDEYDLENKE